MSFFYFNSCVLKIQRALTERYNKQLVTLGMSAFIGNGTDITSLFNIHSLHDIHGIMSIIYKQVIEINIEANNA